MPKKVDHQERRTLIADALMRVAADQGLEAVSLRHVAAAAGVSSGMVQHYFRTKDEMMAARERLITRHPEITWIGAHMGMNDDDLDYASYMLEKYPNYNVDMSSVVHSLGRQPYTARRFFIRYQDRILFGSDGGYKLAPAGSDGWTTERMYRSYFEFLETENEYADYPQSDITKQGHWRVYGLNLPPEVLEKIYYKNALRLLPSHEAVVARLPPASTPPAIAP